MIQEENKPCSEAAFRWLVFRIFDIKWQKSIKYNIFINAKNNTYAYILITYRWSNR